MKIIIGDTPWKTKILTDSGEDITEQLGLTSLNINVDLQSVRVSLECERWVAEADVPGQLVEKTTTYRTIEKL